MKPEFSITLSLKTCEGLEQFASFSIGNARKKAYAIFNQLNGKADVTDRDVLYVDLIETISGLPVNLKLITCTLDQLAENCRIITKEIFKLKNIEELKEEL